MEAPPSPEPSLNPFARRFQAAFSLAFPQWTECVHPYQKWCGPGDPMDECDFFIPNPHGFGMLDVRSWKGLIRLSYECLDETWGDRRARGQDMAIAEAIRFTKELVDESLVIVYRKRLLYWLDSNLFEAVAVPARDGQFEVGSRFLASRSWHGTWNRGERPQLKI